MGNFINAQHKEMIDAVTTGIRNEMLNNPYYIYGNTKATPVIFYLIDNKNTTFDEGMRDQYEPIGKNSPVRFVKINGLYLYGLERIEISYNQADEGLKADPITGDCTDLPNTINPVPGCYFEIPYLNKEEKHYLFKITNCTIDTMDDGNNIHKMTYELDRTDKDIWSALQKQVIKEAEFVTSTYGTDMNCVIESSKFKLAEKLDDISVVLKQYYQELFYSSRVQTFVVKYADNIRLVDESVIEFLMRNKILSNQGGKYMYVSHQNPVPDSFPIDYAKTVFRSVETYDVESLDNAITDASYWLIDNITTIFYTRPEHYYSLRYTGNPIKTAGNMINIFSEDFIAHLRDGVLFDYSTKQAAFNIIIKAMHKLEADFEDLKAIEDIEYAATPELYYTMPLIIFAVESYVKILLSQHTVN